MIHPLMFMQNNIPISLGPIGSAVLIILSIILGIITWRQRAWKSAADAAIAEMGVHKEAHERLSTENRELISAIGTYKSKTDLDPILSALKEWFIEGRLRFDESIGRLNVIHQEQTTALTTVIKELEANRKNSETAFKEMSNTYRDHILDDKKSQIENQQLNLKFLSMLSDLEQRLSGIAVTIGVTKWAEKSNRAGSEKIS